MSDEHNPLIPAGYDIAWSVICALVIAFTIVALVSLARAAKRLTPAQGLLWAALVLLVPVLGALAWLAIGRRTVAVSQDG
ncbi:PLDc N-terminal domain-containing protein [Microbacterium trichothecenolyticum]|uniref:PLDc N-terminal domain-containing protein n=1 Tax=Microbacterium ureisolvens TaxID=2781186 RepID=A0ABS7HXB4_9MICO|nr:MULTISPECIES: PLDc N-terminal domain-containing protein [Microbacterium]MBW9110022.1 PLDc N-terminal domain-containing protein [Microbacterium ureisolvens]MBW9119319.1 PLDc N-terminal domain-containing protein [Microbacterium trichothecenolyticum]